MEYYKEYEGINQVETEYFAIYNEHQQRTAAFVNKEDHCDGSPESRRGDQNYLKDEDLIS